MSTVTSIPSLAELVARCEFDPEVAELIEPGAPVERAVAALRGKEKLVEALKLLTHALPIQRGIAWGFECVSQGFVELSPMQRDTLNAVERWLQAPSDEHRRATFAAGNKSGFDHAIGCLAFSVFLSGGSIAPVGVAEVLPDGPVAARALAGAVLLASLGEGALAAAGKQDRYLNAGLAVLSQIETRS